MGTTVMTHGQLYRMTHGHSTSSRHVGAFICNSLSLSLSLSYTLTHTHNLGTPPHAVLTTQIRRELQDTALHRNTLHHAATCCDTPQHTATHFKTMQHNAAHISVSGLSTPPHTWHVLKSTCRSLLIWLQVSFDMATGLF